MLEVTEEERKLYGFRKGIQGLISGLHAIHSTGFAHFDLKPSNILVYSTGLRIADFGSCRRVYHGRQTGSKSPESTVLYSSPEILFGQVDIGPPADIWSLGLCMYFWCTGKLLVDERSLAAVLKRLWILLGPVPYELSEIVPQDYVWLLGERSGGVNWMNDLTSEFRVLVTDCLRWDPYERPLSKDLMKTFSLFPSYPKGHLIPSLCTGGWLRFSQHSRAICLASIAEAAACMHLRAESFLVALQMLDALVWKLPVTANLLMYSTVCLHVAAKLIDNITPSWTYYLSILNLSCSERDLSKAEADALSKIDYQVRLITAIDALPFYKMLAAEILHILKWFVSTPQLVGDRVLEALADTEMNHRCAV